MPIRGKCCRLTLARTLQSSVPSSALYSHVTTYLFIWLKHSSMLNTCSNDFIGRHNACVTSHKHEKSWHHCELMQLVKGSLLIHHAKFHSLGKCTRPITNIQSDWVSKGFSSLCIIYLHKSPLIHILVCNHVIIYLDLITDVVHQTWQAAFDTQ